MDHVVYNNLIIEPEQFISWIRANIDIENSLPEDIEHDLEDINRVIASAKREADLILQRDEDYFRDEETDPIIIPEDIKQWVFEKAARDYFMRLNSLIQQSISGGETLQVQTQVDWSKLYKHRKLIVG